MSTQSDAGVPLSLLPEEKQQPFRLLELPPELLSVLTSKNPPVLKLKSCDVSIGDIAGHAVLCTPDKSFAIRQKNSSNSVYILQSTQDSTSPDGGIPVPELVGISKLESSLETLSAPSAKASTYVRTLLPMLGTSGNITPGRSQHMTKAQLLANIPLSDAECEAACREHCVFVDHTSGHCLQPSAAVKIDTWSSILENACANAVDLNGELDEDTVLSLKDGLEDLRPGLFEAIIRSVATTTDGRTTIDPDRLVPWIGLNRLGADAPVNTISVSDFKTSWKNALPEKLREKVDLALISDRAQVTASKWIRIRDNSSELVAGAKDAGSAKAPGNKRKWHEKFKPAKKAA